MNASTFYRAPKEDDKTRRPGFDYSSVVLRPVQGIWWLHSIKDYKDEKWGKPEYGFMKLRFLFVRLIPGAQDAKTEAEQTKFRQMGHGKFLSIEVHPICSAPGINSKTKEPTKPSNLYNLLCVLLNDGEPLTDEQLGKVGETELKAWMAEYNKREGVEKITDLRTARVYFAGETLMNNLNGIEAAHPQVYATPETKVSQKTGKKYNTLRKVDALVPEGAGVEGGWQPFEKPYDEREADDDESLSCARCGKHTRGYERRDNQEWVPNYKAAEASVEEFGEVLCGVCIRKERDAAKEAEGEDE